jgi:hypothetical protein
MHVEELVVEVDNGRNVVVVQVAVHRDAHVGKWPMRLRAAREDSLLEPPTVVLKWTAGGDPGWPRGEVGLVYWRLGQQVGTGDGRGGDDEGKEEGREGQGNTREGWGKWLGASVGWARGGQEGRAGGRLGCPSRRISSPNLRPKWMRVDAFEHRCLFRSFRWTECSVRADTFGCAVVVCVGPLEMPLGMRQQRAAWIFFFQILPLRETNLYLTPRQNYFHI